MENPAIILWIPLILIVVLSLLKMARKKGPERKPWIRIEKVEDNEETSYNEVWKPSPAIIHVQKAYVSSYGRHHDIEWDC